MKKILLGFMAVAISFAAMAQSEQGKEGRRKDGGKEFRHKRDKMMKDLNLSETQKARIKSINENFRSQVRSLGNDKSIAPEAQKERREALKKEHKSQITAVLTPEQRKQWEEKMKQHYLKRKDSKRFKRQQTL